MAAHLFVYYWGIMSFITPPVAVGAYVAAGIAGGDPFKTGYIAMKFAFVSYIVPFLFVYSPALMLRGAWDGIIIAIATSIVGVTAISIGFEGFLLRKLGSLERFLFLLGGTAMFIPTAGVSWSIDVGGAALVTLTCLWHIRSVRKLSLQGVRP
jgi:TRAP-type uncharacterized transport system fused permease subunit